VAGRARRASCGGWLERERWLLCLRGMAMEISVCAGGFLSSRSFSSSFISERKSSSSGLENALEKDSTRNSSRRGTRDAYLVPVFALAQQCTVRVYSASSYLSVLLMNEF